MAQSKEYHVGILTDITCSWFLKSVQLQMTTATTTTQNVRGIRELAGFFPHCALEVFPSAPTHRTRATITYLNANNEDVVDSPPPPKSPDLNIIENIWDKLNRRGYSDHTESTESKNSLRVEQPPSELNSALCDVNETSLSCRSEQCGENAHY